MLFPKITVVLGSYNQKTTLEKVLLAYNDQTLDKELFEVVVVDSSSTDGTDEFFKSFKPNFNFRGIIQENKGKAVARNRGVNEASSRYIIITDADMIPDDNFVKAHLDAHLKSKKLSCFEGVAWNMSQLMWPPEESLLTPQVGTHPKSYSKLGWYYFLTGNLSFPKELFDRYQGFDEDFDGYGWEDLELGYRFSKDKIPLYYLHTAINYHYHVIHKDDDIMRNIQKGKSAQIFLKKHPELKVFLGLNPVSVLLRKKMSPTHPVVRFFKETCYGHKWNKLHGLGAWFLSEYNYLSGIMDLPHLEMEARK